MGKIGQIAWNKGISSKIKKYCLTCNKEMIVFKSQKYCSHKCQPSWNKGKKHTAEHIRNFSIVRKGKGLHKGICYSPGTSFKVGHRFSEETKIKIGTSCKGKRNSPKTEFKEGFTHGIKG